MSNAIKKYVYIFFLIAFTALPVFSIEVEHIEAKTISNEIKNTNKKTFNGTNLFNQQDDEYDLENRDPIEIPNPFERKQKAKEVLPTPVQTEISLTSDEVYYNSDSNEVEAKGHVVIITKPEKSKITADRGVYSRANNTIKLFDNVTLYKDGARITGDYMTVDLRGENVLMNEPFGDYGTFKITAKEGYAYANKIETIDGELELAQKVDTVLASYGFGTFYDPTIIQKNIVTDEMKKSRSDKFKIKTHEILINSLKDHDEVIFKDADLYYKKLKLATASDIQIFADKEQNYIETNVPELGSLSDFGTYIGLGYVAKIPYGSTLKLVPSIVSDGQFGVGGIARLRSKRNFTEAAWATSSNNLIVRGKYKFNKRFWIDYGRHAYIDEWYFGSRRAGYLAQLVYDDKFKNKDLDLTFSHRFSAGYVAEYSKEDQNDMPGTMRVRYQSELSKRILEKGDVEQDVWMQLDAFARAAATVYGTGDVTGFFGIGPQLTSRVNRWGSKIALTWNGIGGVSPYRFDEYRYGKVSLFLDENIRINKYLAAGYMGTISPLKDNYEDRLITENKFYVMAGPEDIKVAFSYDTVRSIAAFDIIMLLGGDHLKTHYDKLTIQDMKTLGKKRDKFEDLKFYKLKVPDEEL